MGGDPGLFGPGSVTWELNREQAVLLAGPAAAVLQVAHPQVARGVAAHSRFREDATGRLMRTLDAVYTVAFGSMEEVRVVKERVAEAHRAVRGPGYSAFDPGAQLWVLATLIMGSYEIARHVTGPLSMEEKERFLEENSRFGEVFGLSRDRVPRGWVAFEEYWRGMLEGDVLGSDPICGEVARAVVRPVRPLTFRLLSPVLEGLAVGLMPERLVAKLGLRKGAGTRWLWGILRGGLRWMVPRLPGGIRFAPAYHRACRRLRVG
ncbi:MAG: oxygenase MpaB family protein [Verrucomicrobiia bacterium]